MRWLTVRAMSPTVLVLRHGRFAEKPPHSRAAVGIGPVTGRSTPEARRERRALSGKRINAASPACQGTGPSTPHAMPLEFRDKGTSGTQIAVMSGDVVVANISKAVLPVTAGRWRWSFHMTAVPPGFQQHGSAGSLDEAKAQIEAQWARWLDAAGLGYI
jgi:hypothetical protein